MTFQSQFALSGNSPSARKQLQSAFGTALGLKLQAQTLLLLKYPFKGFCPAQTTPKLQGCGLCHVHGQENNKQ